jgi:hypothetical protein
MNKEEILKLLIDNVRFIEQLKPQDMLIEDTKRILKNNYDVINAACKTLNSCDADWVNDKYGEWMKINILSNPKYKDIKAYPLSPDYLKREIEKLQNREPH